MYVSYVSFFLYLSSHRTDFSLEYEPWTGLLMQSALMLTMINTDDTDKMSPPPGKNTARFPARFAPLGDMARRRGTMVDTAAKSP